MLREPAIQPHHLDRTNHTHRHSAGTTPALIGIDGWPYSH